MTNNKNLPLYKPDNHVVDNIDNIFGLTVKNYISGADKYFVLTGDYSIPNPNNDGCLIRIPDIPNYTKLNY